jgi:hypothetical protein
MQQVNYMVSPVERRIDTSGCVLREDYGECSKDGARGNGACCRQKVPNKRRISSKTYGFVLRITQAQLSHPIYVLTT